MPGPVGCCADLTPVARGRTWTEEEIEVLIKMMGDAAGKPLIARRLDRTQGAIAGQVQRLKLSWRSKNTDDVRPGPSKPSSD